VATLRIIDKEIAITLSGWKWKCRTDRRAETRPMHGIVAFIFRACMHHGVRMIMLERFDPSAVVTVIEIDDKVVRSIGSKDVLQTVMAGKHTAKRKYSRFCTQMGRHSDPACEAHQRYCQIPSLRKQDLQQRSFLILRLRALHVATPPSADL
jgi:hypothetical protein